ncbi:hypothetical protein ABPG75_004582 [Micractinium tetrahymenae]
MAPPLAALGRGLGRLLYRLANTVIVLPLAAAGPLQASLLACNLVLLSIATRRLRRAQFAATVRAVQQMDAESIAFLLRRQLPLWIKFADWERGEHLQSFVTLAWPTFNRMICSIIKREVEERLGSHGEFGRVSFARLSFGRQPPVVTAVKGVPLRDGETLAMVIDMDVRWAGEPDVVMQLSGIPGTAVAVRTCQVSGMLRIVLSPIEEELPFVTGITLSLLDRPYLDFDIRVLGGDVMSLPALGSWLRSSVASIIQERLVWPENLGWRWGPSWDRQQAAQAASSGGRALLAPEQQRRRQLPPPLGVLVVDVVGAELEPRRSTFLGRLKPVSSRLSLLLPAALAVAPELGAHAVSGPAAAWAVLQKGLTTVQASTCRPRWGQSFAFVVNSRHQVLHLLLSHKRSGVLAKGMVQALGADVPLGSTEVAVADILGEAAAQEEWTVQQMLLEAAKLEVSAAAARAVEAAAGPPDSEGEDGYASPAADDDAASFVSASPGSTRSGSSLALAFAAAAAAAAHSSAGASSDDEVESGGAGAGRARRRRQAAAASFLSHQSWKRADTPPPRSLSLLLDRSGSSAGHGGAQWEAAWRQARGPGATSRLQPGGGQHNPLLTPPPPEHAPSWRRSVTRSPSPDRRLGHGPLEALLDPAALMRLQMEQRKPEPKWLAEEGVEVEVASANVLTLAGLLAQAAEPTVPGGPDSPQGSAASEDDDGWLGRLQRHILGQGEAEGEGDEFAPSQAPLAGKLRLRLTWQPVEAEPLPEPLFDPSSTAQQQGQGQQRPGHQRGDSEGQESATAAAAARRGQLGSAPAGHSHPLATPPHSARPSLQLPRDAGGSGGAAEPPKPGQGTVPPSAAGSPDAPPTRQGSMSLLAAAAAPAAAAAVAATVSQPGVLAVRVAHTKLEYGTDLSYPVLAVSIDRRPPDPAAAAGAALLGASPSKPAAAAAAAAAALTAAAGSSPAGLLSAQGPGASTASLASMTGSEAAAAAAAAAGQQGVQGLPPAQQAQQAQQERQRWISMEATPGSRMGLLHWGQVFYIPTSLCEADCQEGRVLVELGEVASATRFNLFGPALYSLDASDSFAEDVKVAAAAAVPLQGLLRQRRLGGSWRLKEATAAVAEADRLDLGRASVQLAWFPLQQPRQVAVEAAAAVGPGAGAAEHTAATLPATEAPLHGGSDAAAAGSKGGRRR